MQCFIEGIELFKNRKLILRGWVVTESEYVDIKIMDKKSYLVRSKTFCRKDLQDALGINLNMCKGFECSIENFKMKTDKINLLIECGSDKIELPDLHITKMGKREEPRKKILFCLDKISYDDKSEELFIRGWAFSTVSDNNVSIELYIGKNRVFNIDANRIRSDVANAYNAHKNALYSGFSNVSKVNAKLNKNIIIKIEDDRGNIVKKKVTLELNNEVMETNKVKIGYQVLRMFGYEILVMKSKAPKIELIKIFYNEYKKRVYKNQMYLSLSKRNSIDVWKENNELGKKITDKINKKNIKINFHIFLPVYNRQNLKKIIDSYNSLNYDNWKLYIFNGINEKELKEYSNNSNIKEYSINELEKVYENTLKLDSKDNYVIFVNEHVLLKKYALAVANLNLNLNHNHNIDIIYCDNDTYEQSELCFKPDWSPEHIMSCNYIGNMIIAKVGVIMNSVSYIHKYKENYIYAILLDFCSTKQKIVHIPYILYSEIIKLDKDKQIESHTNILSDYLNKRNIRANISVNERCSENIYPVFSLDFPDDGPYVDIIIPTKNGYDLLKRCVESISNTSYKYYQITIVDNDSDDPMTIKYLENCKSKGINVKKISNKAGCGFSYSYINNLAALQSKCDYILFLNNDTEIIAPKWLSNMMGYLNLNNVGIVGAKLLFPDNTIQHAGIVHGLFDNMAAPAFKLLANEQSGYMHYPHTTRNYSAVTAACMLIRKYDFELLGGFDDTDFSVAYNDLDLCYRSLFQLDKTCVYVSNAVLYHYEGASRGYVDKIDETLAFREKYKSFIDPYYNINLSKDNEQFEINTQNNLDVSSVLPLKLKVLFNTHNMNLEGAPLQVVEIATGLIKCNKNLEIVFSSINDGRLKTYLVNELDIESYIIDGKLTPNMSISDYENMVNNYVEFIKEQSIDIVYANTIESFFVIDAAHRAGKEAIWFIHESVDVREYFKGYDNYIQKKVVKCFRYAYKIIFCANATKELYNKYDCNSCSTVIHNGVIFDQIQQYKDGNSIDDVKQHLRIPEDRTIILTLGNTCERKGQLDVLKCAKKMYDYGHTNVLFYIVGGCEGEYLDKMQSFIEQNSMEEYVRIIMQTKDTYQYYYVSDVFLCSSYNESYPRVILESMAFDLPIVSTDVYGIKEQVYENVNGNLFEPGDIEMMSSKLADLLENDTKRQLYSTNATKVLKYINSYDEMIEKNEEIILQAWNKANLN